MRNQRKSGWRRVFPSEQKSAPASRRQDLLLPQEETPETSEFSTTVVVLMLLCDQNKPSLLQR